MNDAIGGVNKMKMRRLKLWSTAIGLSLAAMAVLPAYPAQTTTYVQAQSDLTWFVYGLKQLGQSREARLKLQPVQAKKILPVLEGLAQEKILLTEAPKRQVRLSRPGTAAPSEKELQERQARQEKMAKRIQEAIDLMDGMLRREQSDYILNLDFDPAIYGLDRGPQVRIVGGQGQRPSQEEIRKMMQARQAAMERLVKLNREVLEMLKKLAAS